MSHWQRSLKLVTRTGFKCEPTEMEGSGIELIHFSESFSRLSVVYLLANDKSC